MSKKKMVMVGCKMDTDMNYRLETFANINYDGNKSLVMRTALKELFLRKKFNKIYLPKTNFNHPA